MKQLGCDNTLIVPDLTGHGDSAGRTGPIAVGAILAGVEAVVGPVARSRPVTGVLGTPSADG